MRRWECDPISEIHQGSSNIRSWVSTMNFSAYVGGHFSKLGKKRHPAYDSGRSGDACHAHSWAWLYRHELASDAARLIVDCGNLLNKESTSTNILVTWRSNKDRRSSASEKGDAAVDDKQSRCRLHESRLRAISVRADGVLKRDVSDHIFSRIHGQ